MDAGGIRRFLFFSKRICPVFKSALIAASDHRVSSLENKYNEDIKSSKSKIIFRIMNNILNFTYAKHYNFIIVFTMAHELILVIDDDNDLRDFTASCLKEEGFRVEEAADGQEAIDKSSNSEIDLILLDLNLPDMDGEDILAKIKAKNKLLPIIVLSGKQSVSSKVLTLGLGADDYVTKPFSEDELIARIKANLKKYSMFTEISESKNSDLIIQGNITLDQRNFIVFNGGKEEKLSPRLF